MALNYLPLVAYFFGGAFLMNTLPHLVSGVMGRRFPSPFAKPPGKGQSSALTNFFWGFANLIVGYLLVAHVGDFDVRNWEHVGALGLGMFLIGLLTASHFSSLNGGRGPDLA
ncbi:MAG TPA: hypothetical protein VG407_10775 [Caulobacteraceae bacterium]|jgi:hypothetical protein|nr:hypothetical protein [Caulobacteraceae bacterium]